MDITDYLMELDKSQIYHLGLVLGLNRRRVVDLRDSCASSLEVLDAVVLNWIQRLDRVEDVSWSALVKALLHPRLGQTGIANDIAAKYGMYRYMYIIISSHINSPFLNLHCFHYLFLPLLVFFICRNHHLKLTRMEHNITEMNTTYTQFNHGKLM